MINDKMFGGEDSPLRQNPVFRKYMEEYKFLDGRIEEMQRRRGYLSWEEMQELTKLKKLKLACKDGMEKCRKAL